MSQATFSIPAQDFDFAMFEKIKTFLQDQNAEVFIRIKTKETIQETKYRIDNAITDIEQGSNLVSFSMSEFEQLSKNLRS
jgi:hypothetical protein